MRLNMIIYDHTVPESVRPVANEEIMYVSHGCYNHALGTGGCGDNTTNLGKSNKADEAEMKEWGEICNEVGCSIWYYSHGVNYACTLAPSPNVTDFYWNAKFLRECGFKGIFYEGYPAGDNYPNFEDLKAYLVAKLAFYPDMSYDEFTDYIKEFMYMYYGDGYEEVYQYMLLQTACGDAAGCFINNYDRPFDMYDPATVKANYEEMRNLVLTAIDKAETDSEIKHCKNLMVSCDFLGLTAWYKDMYTNGDEESRATYEERFTDLYNYIKDNDIPLWSSRIYTLPDTISFDEDPMVQFIKIASWRNVEY